MSLGWARSICLFVVALGVRLVWMPTWSRLRFDGHEADYLASFQGAEVPGSSHAYPLLSWLYRGLGILVDDPRALVVFSALVGSVAVVCVGVWTAGRFGRRAGLWAGLLVAVLGEHAAWSTSAYNVILPHALLVASFVVSRGWAAIMLALAASMRAEIALLGLLRGWAGLAGGVGLLWPIEWAQPSNPWQALEMNWPLVRYLGPPVLVVGLWALRDRKAWALGLAVLWVHLVGSAFDDYGTRHALLGGVLLCVLVAVAIDRARRGWVIGVLVMGGMLFDTHDLSQAWHRHKAPAAAALDLPALAEGCVEVSEEPPLAGQVHPSHYAFFQGEIDGPCVVWGEESWHGLWSSRGLRDRALRMRTRYRLTPVGAWRPGAGRPVRVYQRLERR